MIEHMSKERFEKLRPNAAFHAWWVENCDGLTNRGQVEVLISDRSPRKLWGFVLLSKMLTIKGKLKLAMHVANAKPEQYPFDIVDRLEKFIGRIERCYQFISVRCFAYVIILALMVAIDGWAFIQIPLVSFLLVEMGIKLTHMDIKQRAEYLADRTLFEPKFTNQEMVEFSDSGMEIMWVDV